MGWIWRVGNGRSELRKSLWRIAYDADGSVNDENDSADEDGAEGSGEDDEDMEVEEPKPVSSDPNDLTAFKMEDYDNEESKGVGG